MNVGRLVMAGIGIAFTADRQHPPSVGRLRGCPPGGDASLRVPSFYLEQTLSSRMSDGTVETLCCGLR